MVLQDFTRFETQLAQATTVELDKDKFQGTRYTVRVMEAGIDVPLRLPGCWLNMGPVHREEAYIWVWPEDPLDKYFLEFENSIDALEEWIKDELHGKYQEYTSIVKTERRNGLSIKLYTTKEPKKITSKFVDFEGEIIDLNADDRCTAKNISRTIYPIINIDSVYISSDKKLSVQLKLAEGLVEFTDTQSVLDPDVITRLRAMKVSNKKGKK